MAILLVRHLHGRGPFAFVVLIGVALLSSLAAGELVHRLIELPLLKAMKGKGLRGVSTAAGRRAGGIIKGWQLKNARRASRRRVR